MLEIHINIAYIQSIKLKRSLSYKSRVLGFLSENELEVPMSWLRLKSSIWKHKAKLIRKHSLSEKYSCKEFLERIALNAFDAEERP